MKIQRLKKGEFGYPKYQAKYVIARTVFYFALSLAIFIMGYLSTKTKENLLTIVAVLGLLPSSKSLVSVIMYLRMPKFSREVYDGIAGIAGDMPVLYSLYLTSYKKNFPVSCFCVTGGNIVGYTEFAECDTAAGEEHIKELLKQNRLKNYNIKIFAPREQKRFEDRLKQLSKLEAEGREAEVMELLCDISL